MSTARPVHRKSSLQGSNPVAPSVPPVTEQASPAVTAELRPAAANSSTSTTAPAQPAGEGRKKPKPKVSFYQDPEDTARMRGALKHTQVAEGSRSLSDFIDRAVMAEVERLEARYNNGQPFESVGARELPQGRPLGT